MKKQILAINSLLFFFFTGTFFSVFAQSVEITQLQTIDCNGDSTTLLAQAVGFTPVSFTWSDGSKGTSIRTGAGAYTVDVADDTGSVFSAGIVVNEPLPLSIAQTTITEPTDWNADGSITADGIAGGRLPYTLNLQGNSVYGQSVFLQYPAINSSQFVYTSLAGGNYTISVIDSRGCVFAAPSIQLTDNAAPLRINNLTTQNGTYYNSDDGSVNFSVSGGRNYIDVWLNGQLLTRSASYTISNLKAGAYTIIAEDQTHINGSKLRARSEFQIYEPQKLIVSASVTNKACHYTNSVSADGMIQLSVQGGTTPLVVDLYNSSGTLLSLQNNAYITDRSGFFYWKASDARGDIDSGAVYVTEPAEPLSPVFVLTHNPYQYATQGKIEVVSVTEPYGWSVFSGFTVQIFDSTGLEPLNERLPSDRFLVVTRHESTGCVDSSFVTINDERDVFDIPALFTTREPFFLEQLAYSEFKDVHIELYDLKKQRVLYTSTDATQEWDYQNAEFSNGINPCVLTYSYTNPVTSERITRSKEILIKN